MNDAEAEAAWLAHETRHAVHAFRPHCLAQRLSPVAERFLFLRHGETHGNQAKIFQHPEIELNEAGLSQAAAAAELLAGCGARRICASTMRRAWQTAELAGRALALTPIAEAGLRERWFGDLVGTSSEHLDWSYDPPNGETLREFVVRTCEAVARSLQSQKPTLLVAHRGVLFALAYSLQVPLREDMVRNATPLLFERTQGSWRARPHIGTAEAWI